MRLWYQSPAEDWNSALPLGNGKLGAMVFGGPVAERIQLNEDSVWSGGFRDRVNPDCKNNLPEIRRLLREGDIAQAENLATLAMAGTPEFERMYQTLGDIYLTMENQAGEVEHYTRQLDLDNALCTVSYTSGGVDYTREAYISAPHNVMVVRLGSGGKGGVRCACTGAAIPTAPSRIRSRTPSTTPAARASGFAPCCGPPPWAAPWRWWGSTWW